MEMLERQWWLPALQVKVVCVCYVFRRGSGGRYHGCWCENGGCRRGAVVCSASRWSERGAAAAVEVGRRGGKLGLGFHV
ncbi:hypothetical protein DEO72_LG10g1819 [Vigna unguiculata]|uniref:Uncharacterized protein n=1 Tax=Vigna unguiculata TaxID=3917 RepID=A0A4D6NDG6_VIGUN|nr:hypothetical protein DEO72_LG10g1819 [Vigna unguiculata]